MIMQSGFTFWNFIADVFVIFLFIMWIWLLISVFADLFRRKDIGGAAKVIWIIFLLVLPFLGVFIYLLTQGSSMNAAMPRRRATPATICARSSASRSRTN